MIQTKEGEELCFGQLTVELGLHTTNKSWWVL